jgi:hypothetical protein
VRAGSQPLRTRGLDPLQCRFKALHGTLDTVSIHWDKIPSKPRARKALRRPVDNHAQPPPIARARKVDLSPWLGNGTPRN